MNATADTKRAGHAQQLGPSVEDNEPKHYGFAQRQDGEASEGARPYGHLRLCCLRANRMRLLTSCESRQDRSGLFPCGRQTSLKDCQSSWLAAASHRFTVGPFFLRSQKRPSCCFWLFQGTPLAVQRKRMLLCCDPPVLQLRVAEPRRRSCSTGEHRIL